MYNLDNFVHLTVRFVGNRIIHTKYPRDFRISVISPRIASRRCAATNDKHSKSEKKKNTQKKNDPVLHMEIKFN